jgi:hypothetical protein
MTSSTPKICEKCGKERCEYSQCSSKHYPDFDLATLCHGHRPTSEQVEKPRCGGKRTIIVDTTDETGGGDAVTRCPGCPDCSKPVVEDEWDEASMLFHTNKYEQESGKGIERILAYRDKCLAAQRQEFEGRVRKIIGAKDYMGCMQEVCSMGGGLGNCDMGICPLCYASSMLKKIDQAISNEEGK